MNRPRVLFLCTGNSCRSQMAEGMARHLIREDLDAYSAGTKPQGLNPNAVKVMREIGIDISNHSTKSVEEFGDLKFNFIITVCDEAHKSCPIWPGSGMVLHHGFDDPPRLSRSSTSEEETLQHYRRVRDEIKEFVLNLPQTLRGKK